MDYNKYYIFDNREDAQALVDILTEAYAAGIPYTEVRESNNGQGFAVQDGEWTLPYADGMTPVFLPDNFYVEQ